MKELFAIFIACVVINFLLDIRKKRKQYKEAVKKGWAIPGMKPKSNFQTRLEEMARQRELKNKK